MFAYFNLLVSRPEGARAMGARARAWVERDCNWDSVARRYLDFLEGKQQIVSEIAKIAETASEQINVDKAAQTAPQAVQVDPTYITSWAPVENGSRPNSKTHLTLLERSLPTTRPVTPPNALSEMAPNCQSRQ